MGSLALALALPMNAPAAEMIGETGPVVGCAPNLTYMPRTVAAGTPDYSPTQYGVITSWSAMAQGTPDRTVKLVILRPDFVTGPDNFIAVQKDSVRTLAQVNALNTFTSGVRLPIDVGDRLALYIPAGQPGGSGSCDWIGGAGNSFRWLAGEAPFGTSLAYPPGNDRRLNASALVEPDTDRDVFGDETQDKCVGSAGAANGCPSTVTIDKLKQKGDTKVKATVTVPGAGTLEVGSPSDPALASAAAKKSLKAVTQTLTATTKQQVKLTLKLTKSAIGKLDEAGKLKVKVKAVYTPVGGPAGSQTKKKKLKT